MSYVYRERERDRDYDDRNVTIKRYVIPSDEREDRREFIMRDDVYDNELVIRRKTEREEPVSIQRYERDVEYDLPVRRYEREVYEPRYVSPRQSEYEVDEEIYRRRVDDRHSRRDLSPRDSISQASRQRGRTDYSSDDEYYYHEETRTYDGERPHHRRHLAEGALVGAGAAELFRNHRKREGEEVSHGISHAVKTAGAGALGAVAVNAAGHVRDYYRSKSRSRHRGHSDDDRSYRHSHRSHSHGRRSRSRSRSHSHSRAKTLLEVGLGAAAIAAGVAALRSKKNADERTGRSRTRSRSRARSTARSDKDSARSVSQRNKHMAGAGLAGAAVAGLVEHHRSKSRSRKGERSHSRLRQALPVLAAGLGTAAATGIWEKKKAEKEEREGRSRGTSRSGRSRSRGAPDSAYPDPTRDSAGLIEYGKDPVTGSIPAEHYYGAPTSPGPAYYSDGAEYSRRQSRDRSRSRSRAGRRNDSSSGSDRSRRHRKHRSRSRDVAGAALGAGGLGYAAHKYSQSRERKKAEREQDRARYDNVDHHDPYEESYDPEPYPPSRTAPNYQEPPANYYPNTNNFPPPPGSTTNLNATTPPPNAYNPAEYPPPPGAAPQPQAYNYGAPGPGTEQYAPRPRRVDENVSAQRSLPTDHHTEDDLAQQSQLAKAKSVPRFSSQSEPLASKSVSFNLNSEGGDDRGYETDDSDSAFEGPSHRRRSSSVPHQSMPHSPDHRSGHTHSHHSSTPQTPSKTELDSDSTIDLPQRFDRKGHLLMEKEEDPAVAKIEDFINRFTKVLF